MTQVQDEPTDQEIAESTEAGDAIFFELLERVSVENVPDEIAALFAIWVCLTRFLADHGWSEEDLAADALRHAAEQTCEGTA